MAPDHPIKPWGTWNFAEGNLQEIEKLAKFCKGNLVQQNCKEKFNIWHLMYRCSEELHSSRQEVVIGENSSDERVKEVEQDIIDNDKSDEAMETSDCDNHDSNRVLVKQLSLPSSQRRLILTQMSQPTQFISTQPPSSADYVVEGLESGNIQEVDFESLCSMSEKELEQLLQELSSKLSDAGLGNLCMFVCKMGLQGRSMLSPMICRHMLVPKLHSLRDVVPHALSSALVEFAAHFPHVVCSNLVVPLLRKSPFNSVLVDTIVAIVKDGLKAEHRTEVLKAFATDVPRLEEAHFLLLQTMIEISGASCSEDTNSKLLKLMSVTSPEFSRNIKFARVLLSVIKNIGPKLSVSLKCELQTIIISHQTFMKRILENNFKQLD